MRGLRRGQRTQAAGRQTRAKTHGVPAARLVELPQRQAQGQVLVQGQGQGQVLVQGPGPQPEPGLGQRLVAQVR